MQGHDLYITDVCSYLPKTIPLEGWLQAKNIVNEKTEDNFFEKHLNEAFVQTQVIYNGKRSFSLSDIQIKAELLEEKITVADKDSQYDLAYKAMKKLVDRSGCEDVDLLLYCHTSIDENVLQSNVCRLAKDFELGKIQHFSLGQAQGASFFTALELIDSIMEDNKDMQSAIVVFSEKWAHPYSRVFYQGTVYEDGAVAIKISRNAKENAFRVASNKLMFQKPFLSMEEKGYVWDECRVKGELIQFIKKLFSQVNPINPNYILGTSGCRKVDSFIAENFQGHEFQRLEKYRRGYLSAAEIPYLLTLLEGVEKGKSQVLVWGVGCAGTLGGTLLERDA